MNKLAGFRTQSVKVVNTKTHYWMTLEPAHIFTKHYHNMHFDTVTWELYFYDLRYCVPQPKTVVLHGECNVICVRCKKWPDYMECAQFIIQGCSVLI